MESTSEASAVRCPPVLVVMFNRPEVIMQMVEALRVARPDRLLVAADGPRHSNPTDVLRCEEARAILDQIDWPCKITRRFRDENLGLQASMIDAIDWFFTEVDAGIILEDDCLVHPDFFTFASELLERHRDDAQVMAISALNLAPNRTSTEHSYFFASAGNIWGWATWRRAWVGYDPEMSDWPNRRDEFLDGASPLQVALARRFDRAHGSNRNTWARAWHYHVAVNAGLVVVPAVNLVRNVGFGRDATHTVSRRHSLAELHVGALPGPFDGPPTLGPNLAYEDHLRRFHTRGIRVRIRDRVQELARSLRVSSRQREGESGRTQHGMQNVKRYAAQREPDRSDTGEEAPQ